MLVKHTFFGFLPKRELLFHSDVSPLKLKLIAPTSLGPVEKLEAILFVLPKDIVYKILQMVGVRDLCRLSQTCRAALVYSRADVLWKAFCEEEALPMRYKKPEESFKEFYLFQRLGSRVQSFRYAVMIHVESTFEPNANCEPRIIFLNAKALVLSEKHKNKGVKRQFRSFVRPKDLPSVPLSLLQSKKIKLKCLEQACSFLQVMHQFDCWLRENEIMTNFPEDSEGDPLHRSGKTLFFCFHLFFIFFGGKISTLSLRALTRSRILPSSSCWRDRTFQSTFSLGST